MDETEYRLLLIQLSAAQQTARRLRLGLVERILSMAVLEALEAYQDNAPRGPDANR